MFDFYVPKKYLYNKKKPKNVYVSWTRVGPWLPWMKMQKHEGMMVYHARSELLYDWNKLPEKVKARVEKDFPEYKTAPDKVDPNAVKMKLRGLTISEEDERKTKEKW